MKILFICPTNPRYMPYLDNYTELPAAANMEKHFLVWDRFEVEEDGSYTIFRRGKKQHQRNFIDYHCFGNFIKAHLKKNHYEKVICFGLQTAFFIRNTLLKKYPKKYIIDIRDYNKIAKFYSFSKVIEKSAHTVISSPGYTSWLPRGFAYTTNHNTKIDNLSGIYPSHSIDKNEVKIASIGALRDLKINIDLIKSAQDSLGIRLSFHGRGDINSELEKFAENSKTPIDITGFYLKEDEPDLYRSADLINVLRYPDCINNITALPNRLYLAPFLGKPLLSYPGTYLGEVVKKNNLGLVLNTFESLNDQINKFIDEFNQAEFDKARKLFLAEVIDENKKFKQLIEAFLRQ